MNYFTKIFAFTFLCSICCVTATRAETYHFTQDFFNTTPPAPADGSMIFAKLPKKTVKVDLVDSQTTSPVPKDSGVWWSVYTGTDLSVLGEISTQLKGINDYAEASGDPSTLSVDHIGILGGTEFGVDLDRDNSLSLSFENVWTSNQTIAVTAGSDHAFEKFGPSLFGVSLNYSRMIDNHPGSKMSFKIGLGYYHSNLNLDSNLEGDEFAGDFGGDILGGTLGITEELSLGGDLGLELTARGRIANFSKLTGSNATENGTALPGGPFALVDVPSSPVNQVEPIPTSFALPPGINYTQLDYSGFDGNVALVWHL